jgi:anti-anti-sigma factor
VLRLVGELDISVQDPVAREIRDHVELVASSVTIVDLSAVTFMDSAGLDPLLQAHAALAGQERVLALQEISRPVERLFRLLANLLPYGLVQQTLRSVQTPSTAGGDPGVEGPRTPGLPAGDFQSAIRSHTMLNEAIGSIMAVHDCDADQAEVLLELISRNRGLAVADLVAGIVAAADASQTHSPGADGPAGLALAMRGIPCASALGSNRPGELAVNHPAVR